MKLFEFQAKNILKEYGVSIPRGIAISRSADAPKTFQEIGCKRCVIKAQILAGGRGKGGGIQFASSPEEAQACVVSMLGTHLVTYQTGQKGTEIKYVLIEEALPIKKNCTLQ